MAKAPEDLSRIAESLRPLAVRTADLAFLADNPLDHDDDEVADMRAILQRRGQLAPLIVNRRSTPPVVLGGNKRLQAMLAEGWEWVAVVNVDLAEDDAAALAIELNATQGTSWNQDLLQKAMHQVGKLTLGERTEGLFARLAEAQKLIPGDQAAKVELKQLDLRKPPVLTWVLIGIPTVRFGEIAADVERIAALPKVLCEVTANDGPGKENGQP